MASQPVPTPSFQRVVPNLTTVDAGVRFGRIYLSKHPDPLGFVKSPSRFSDPRRRIAARRFGVLYLGSTLKVCFLEAILRDARNGAVGDYPIEEREIHARSFAEIEVVVPLSLVDLRGDGPVRMGVPSDVARASRQALARKWSQAFHEHPSAPDGIIYPSRLNAETNVAVYDRAIAKLRVSRVYRLIDAAGLPGALDDLRVAIV